MSGHKHDTKTGDMDTTLVNIPQLEFLRKLADEQEKELNDNRRKDQDRERKVTAVHADLYDKIEKLQLQIEDKNRRELGMNERLHKAEERFHQLESSIEDVVRIRSLEERIRGVENQLNMKAPSKLMDLEAGMSQLQRLIRENEVKYKENERKMGENERKVQEAIVGINMQFHTLTSAQTAITDANKHVKEQLVRLERQKMDRAEMNDSLDEITRRQKEYKTQLNSYTDTFEELTRSIRFLGDEFKAELEAQRKRTESELSAFNHSVGDVQQACENLNIKVASLEELMETVAMLQRQLEDWNTEHNRLNDKVDVILQKKVRELVVQVKAMDEKKQDKNGIMDLIKHQQRGLPTAADIKKLMAELKEAQTSVGELQESAVVDREAAQTNHSSLVTGLVTYDKSLAEFRDQLDKLSKREFTVVNAAPAPAPVVVPEDHSEEYEAKFVDIFHQLEGLNILHHEFEWMKQELERIATGVAENTGSKVEVERYVPPQVVVAQAPAADPGYGQVLHDIRDRLDILEHQYVTSAWVSEHVQRETDSVRSALDVRIDDLTRSIGVGFDELRDEIDTYDYQIVDIQRWITNFLQKNQEAANVTVNVEGVYADLPAIHTKCLVCKREPYSSGGIDYTSDALAFNPVFAKNRSTNPMGRAAVARRVADDLIVAADARDAQEKIMEKNKRESELLHSTGPNNIHLAGSYALKRNLGSSAHGGRSSPPHDSFYNHHQTTVIPSAPAPEIPRSHSPQHARTDHPASSHHSNPQPQHSSAAPTSARERDTLRHSYTTPVLPENPETERKRPSSAGPTSSKIASGKKKGLYRG